MAITISSEKEIEFFKLMGKQYEEGFTPAFDHDRQWKGVVDAGGNFHLTLPLNGWRSRNLAEYTFGEREAGLLTLGTTRVIKLSVLEGLPSFDQKYYDLFETMAKLGVNMVVIQVVEVDPGYGCHIRIASGIPNSIV